MVEGRPREILRVVEIGRLQFLPVPEDDGLFHVSVPLGMFEILPAEKCQSLVAGRRAGERAALVLIFAPASHSLA
jgi:hypothetical protein